MLVLASNGAFPCPEATHATPMAAATPSTDGTQRGSRKLAEGRWLMMYASGVKSVEETFGQSDLWPLIRQGTLNLGELGPRNGSGPITAS